MTVAAGASRSSREEWRNPPDCCYADLVPDAATEIIDGAGPRGRTMSREQTVIESLEIHCAEEDRDARLLVEWSSGEEPRKLVSVQCDNPRLASLEPWDCHWSCWRKIAAGRR